MLIGQRIRDLRERKGLTQSDIEEASGLRQCYLAWVERGQAVPTLEALERIAAALEVPLYWLFYVEDNGAAKHTEGAARDSESEVFDREKIATETRFLMKLAELAGAQVDPDPASLLEFARRMVTGKPIN
jgi:transcriptional regulator with XRE-family HTH domain